MEHVLQNTICVLYFRLFPRCDLKCSVLEHNADHFVPDVEKSGEGYYAMKKHKGLKDLRARFMDRQLEVLGLNPVVFAGLAAITWRSFTPSHLKLLYFGPVPDAIVLYRAASCC